MSLNLLALWATIVAHKITLWNPLSFNLLISGVAFTWINQQLTLLGWHPSISQLVCGKQPQSQQEIDKNPVENPVISSVQGIATPSVSLL